jgi:ubiquinone biosynthesis protein Coq4
MDVPADELRNRFTYHAPQGDQAERYGEIRAKALEFAELICERTVASREQSLALTKLDEVVFFANAAIARREGPQ